jgi:hypothetical protein
LGNEKGIGHGAWSMERSDMRTRTILEAEMRRQRAEDKRQKIAYNVYGITYDL